MPSDREGENVGLNQDVAAAHQALMDSPPHRRNILDPDLQRGWSRQCFAAAKTFTSRRILRSGCRSTPNRRRRRLLQGAIEKVTTSHGAPTPARKSQPQLRHMACDMALNDALDNQRPRQSCREFTRSFVWTAGDPANYPDRSRKAVVAADCRPGMRWELVSLPA